MTANQIKEARIKAGLSQAELAEKVNVTQATISNWENNNSAPSGGQKTTLKTILGTADSGASEETGASALAAWLKKARIAKALSVPELANKSGLTPPAIYRIEAGTTRNLRDTTRKQLEQALGIQIPGDTAEEVAQEAKVEGLGSLEDFDPHNDGERPREPGIYVFYDISDRPVYVGEGDDVRSRILDHAEKFWFKRPIVEYASWIKVADRKLRKQTETLLIKFLKSNAVLNKQNVER